MDNKFFNKKEADIAIAILEEILKTLHNDKQVSERVHYYALSEYKADCATMEEAFCKAFINFLAQK